MEENMFNIGDKVRCIGDSPGVWGRIISLTGSSATVRWSDGMTFHLFVTMLQKI
jgi:hypothetical protein